MTKTLGTLSFKTPIQDIGDHMIETGSVALGVPLAGGKICTHIWTTDTSGGTVFYFDIAGNQQTIYLARELGIVPLLFTKIVTGGTLVVTTLWWGRTANHILLEQVPG